jgi:hypothetical protein
MLTAKCSDQAGVRNEISVRKHLLPRGRARIMLSLLVLPVPLWRSPTNNHEGSQFATRDSLPQSIRRSNWRLVQVS